MKLRLLLIPMVALAGVLGVSTYANAANEPVTRTISVGGGGSAVATNDFFPDAVTIRKGDTLHFANTYEEPHTTTFIPQIPQPMSVPDLLIPNPGGPGMVFNPLAFDPSDATASVAKLDPHNYYNSGFMFKGASVDVMFDVVGSYRIICLIHPGMELSVDVAGTPITIASQADLDKKGTAQRDDFIVSGKAIAAAAMLAKTTATSGASTWDLGVGATLGQVDVMQFLPAGPLNIATGDSVKWTSTTDTPHTVTFGDLFNPFATFGKYTAFSPAAALPSGGSTYSGGAANSGLMDKSGQVPGGSTYSLTFTKAGKYTYACLLHGDQGMTGTIIVSDKAPAASAPPIKPPNTGTGGAAGTLGSWLPALLMLGIAGVALVVAGTRAVTKREV